MLTPKTSIAGERTHLTVHCMDCGKVHDIKDDCGEQVWWGFLRFCLWCGREDRPLDCCKAYKDAARVRRNHFSTQANEIRSFSFGK